MTKLAIIGGTGLSQLSEIKLSDSKQLDTPYGKPSANYICGEINGQQIIFLARHGDPHNIPPHKINYRANIWGLQELGVTDIIAVAAVGGITPLMAPSHLAIPDQIIDYSYAREHTFFAENIDSMTHIDFTYPYNQQLRFSLIAAAKKADLVISNSATYGCTQGPRLESAAEIIRMERDGCDLVGMTGMPEAALAKELDLHYAAIAVVANWAAGKSEGEITLQQIEHNLKSGITNVIALLTSYIATATG